MSSAQPSLDGQSPSALMPMVQKLQLWAPLGDDDVAALLALPYQLRTVRPREMLVREHDRPTYCSVLLSGNAIRHKMTWGGARQILSIHMTGDMVDLHNSLLRSADHTVEALTPLKAAYIPVDAIRAVAFARPEVGQAMWYETLIDASIAREWTLNIGRRNALARTAHLLCEFAVRMAASGLVDMSGYELPMTQEQLADALGLTPIHVNRTIKVLNDDGLITHKRRAVEILDFEGLAKLGEFDPRYLHLSQATRPPPDGLSL